MSDTTDLTLQAIYYNPKTGDCGALELYRRAKKRSTTITLKAVKESRATKNSPGVQRGE